IEGAHAGVGLGHQFLRHVERTRVLVHVIDMGGAEGRDPYDDFLKIHQELKAYDHRLVERPQIIAANKMDMPGAEERLHRFNEQLREKYPVYQISALTKTGIQELLYAIADKPDKIPKAEPETARAKRTVVHRHEKETPPFEISRDSDGAFVLSGEKVEKLFKRTDLTWDKYIRRFVNQLCAREVEDEWKKGRAEDD